MESSRILDGILAHWTELRGQGHLPARAQISPRALGALLPHVCLIDLIPGTATDLQYRLVGSHIRNFLDVNLKGHQHSDFRDMPAEPLPNQVYFARCLESKKPQRWESRFQLPNKGLKRMSAVCAPLADDGVIVTGIILGVVFHESAVAADLAAPH